MFTEYKHYTNTILNTYNILKNQLYITHFYEAQLSPAKPTQNVGQLTQFHTTFIAFSLPCAKLRNIKYDLLGQ